MEKEVEEGRLVQQRVSNHYIGSSGAENLGGIRVRLKMGK
jgi:hypothetical protein